MSLKLTKLPLYLGMAVLTLSLIVSGLQLSKKGSQTQTASQASSNTANLIIIPSKGSYRVGDLIDIAVSLSSVDRVKGADVVLKFNPNLTSVDPLTIKAGNAFSLIGTPTVENKNGLIKLSLVTNSEGEMNAILFTARMNVLRKGAAEIHFMPDTDILADGSVHLEFKTSDANFEYK